MDGLWFSFSLLGCHLTDLLLNNVQFVDDLIKLKHVARKLKRNHQAVFVSQNNDPTPAENHQLCSMHLAIPLIGPWLIERFQVHIFFQHSNNSGQNLRGVLESSDFFLRCVGYHNTSKK